MGEENPQRKALISLFGQGYVPRYWRPLTPEKLHQHLSAERAKRNAMLDREYDAVNAYAVSDADAALGKVLKRVRSGTWP